jgi:hypothetical protein
VDALWKFKAMHEFRDGFFKQDQFHELLMHTNPYGGVKAINPITILVRVQFFYDT